jgi:SAM-dependent methyltransferase
MDRFQNTRQPDWEWWGKLWPTPGATLSRLGITSGKTLVEVGCGNGYFALPAARITDPAPVYAFDLDEALLSELTHIAEQQDIDNIVPIHGDARSLAQYIPDAVGIVLIANTFHGIDDTARLVQQVFDSLRPEGCFIIVNWHDLPRETTTVADEPRGPPTDRRMSPQETKNTVLEAADFTLKQRVDLPPYHYALLFDV